MGARRAGYNPVLGIDQDKKFLALFKRFNPDCTCLQLELGSEGSMATVVNAICAVVALGERFHLHASPPCNFMCPDATRGTPEEQAANREKTLELVRFVLRLVLIELPNEKRTPTITFENHYHRELVALRI